MEYNYNKKSILKWVLLYLVLGALVYAGIYFFFYKKGGYSYTPQNNQTQKEETTYKNDKYGFSFTYSTKDLCAGQGGSDAAGNVSLVDLCPSSTTGIVSVVLKSQIVTNGILEDVYFRNLKDAKVVDVGGKTAYQYLINQDGCKGYLTAIPVKDKTLEVSLDNCFAGRIEDQNFPANGVSFMNQLLSTFTFTK